MSIYHLVVFLLCLEFIKILHFIKSFLSDMNQEQLLCIQSRESGISSSRNSPFDFKET